MLAYRIILFWLPLLAGGIAFAALRRDIPRGGELASCAPAISARLLEPTQGAVTTGASGQLVDYAGARSPATKSVSRRISGFRVC